MKFTSAYIFLALFGIAAQAEVAAPRPTKTVTVTITVPPSSTKKTSTKSTPIVTTGTQSLYGQCGGQNYVGPTLCPKGAYCRDGLLDDNPFYSQCVASSTAAPEPTVTKTVTVTAKPGYGS